MPKRPSRQTTPGQEAAGKLSPGRSGLDFNGRSVAALRAGRLCLASACALTFLGCNVQDGFMSFGEEFFEPGVQYFNVPGTRLAEGQYGDLRVQVATDGQRYVAALKNFRELTFSYFDDTPQCSLGDVADFGNAVPPFAEGDEGEELLPYLKLDVATGVSTLHFAKRNCEDVDLTIENSRLPSAVLDDAGPDETRGFLVRTADDRLLLADPWNDVAHEIGTGISQLKLERQNIFSIENGELVVRDRGLVELGRVGNDVTRFTVNPDSTEVAYAQGTALYTVRMDELDAPTQMEEDACQFEYGLGGEDTRLAYLSPCATGRLVITDASGENRIEYVEGVTILPTYTFEDGQLRVVYVTGSAPGAEDGTLWMRVDEEEPVKIHDNGNLYSLTVLGDELFFSTEFDGTVGTYVHWQDGEITEIAEGVAEVIGTWLLANFDSATQTGDLLVLGEDGATEEVGKGVPLRGRRGNAFLANFDGVVGDLMWLEDGKPPAIEIGNGVGKSAFGFGVQFEAVIYLKDRNPDDGTSTLTIRLVETGDVFEIREGVSESREVAFPRPGILYSVLAGEEPGIWYAHAR